MRTVSDDCFAFLFGAGYTFLVTGSFDVGKELLDFAIIPSECGGGFPVALEREVYDSVGRDSGNCEDRGRGRGGIIDHDVRR